MLLNTARSSLPSPSKSPTIGRPNRLVRDHFAGFDDEIVIEVEAPLAGVVEADFVAVADVAVEVAGDRNRAGDVEIAQAAAGTVRMSVPSVTTPSLLVSMIQRKMPPSWAELP